jgi:hypothetical protein
VIACIALFVALGGTGYAVSQLPRNSVGTPQLKDNAVVSAKVKDHSLRANDFAAGQIPRGPTGNDGPTGEVGPTGPMGPTGAAGELQSFDDLDGTPCDVGNAGEGELAVSYEGDGTVTIACVPVPRVDFCSLQFQDLMPVAGVVSPDVFGRIFESGVTEAAGPDATVGAEVGYGPSGSDPRSNPDWFWTPATWNLQDANDDEYAANFNVPAAGEYLYTYRFTLDNGDHYTYCDLDGNGTNAGLSFDLAKLGYMSVTP